MTNSKKYCITQDFDKKISTLPKRNQVFCKELREISQSKNNEMERASNVFFCSFEFDTSNKILHSILFFDLGTMELWNYGTGTEKLKMRTKTSIHGKIWSRKQAQRIQHASGAMPRKQKTATLIQTARGCILEQAYRDFAGISGEHQLHPPPPAKIMGAKRGGYEISLHPQRGEKKQHLQPSDEPIARDKPLNCCHWQKLGRNYRQMTCLEGEQPLRKLRGGAEPMLRDAEAPIQSETSEERVRHTMSAEIELIKSL